MPAIASKNIEVRGWLFFSAACLMFFGAGLKAAEVVPARRDRIQQDLQIQAAQAREFLLELSLSRRQARAVLPVFEEACRVRTEGYLSRAEIQPLEIEAYGEFLKEDRRNQGFTPDVEKRTAQINRRAKEALEKMTDDLNALAEQVRSILSPGQQQTADDYKPAKKANLQVGNSSDKPNKAGHRRARTGQVEATRNDDGDSELAGAQRELDELNKNDRTPQDAIAKYLLSPAAAEPLYELTRARMPRAVREAVDCWQSGTKEYHLEQCQQDLEKIQALRKEINNWNLANGMHFDVRQIKHLLSLADQAESLRSVQRKPGAGNKLPPETFNARLVELEIAAESLLRPGQLEVLKTYKACLIPPKNLKDPVRVGQAAGSSTQMAKWLDRARGKSNKQVERMIEKLLEDEAAHTGPAEPEVLDVRRSLLRETVRRASEMSDVQFALSKDELAEDIGAPNRKDELGAKIDVLRRESGQPGRTAQFLLDPGFAKVLKMLAAQLSEGSSP